MSEALNVITVELSTCLTANTAPALYQYDYGQILLISGLDLPEAYQVHFATSESTGTSVTMIGNSEGVQIPDSLLETGKTIYAFIYLHEGNTDGETEYRITIPVIKRPAITNETPTPTEQSAIDQAIVALNAAVDKAEGFSGDAEESAIEAGDKATEASESALDSEAWAVGERNGEAVGSDDPTYRNNSKFYAELAAQHAEDAGFAFFDINDQTGMMEVTVSDNLAADVRFQIDESTGNLEVIVS